MVIGVVVWLFVSMAIGIIIGVVGLVLVIVGVILSTTKQPAAAQPPVNNTMAGTIPNAVTTPPAGQARFCTGCGARVALENSFCPGCGKKTQA